MKLIGYIAPPHIKSAFMTPVFEVGKELVFQNLTNGEISSFSPIGEYASVLMHLTDAQQGDFHLDGEPAYVYLDHDRQTVAGKRKMIEPKLLQILESYETPLFAKLEIAVFLKDRDLFLGYIERIKTDMVERKPNFQGVLVLEGLDPQDPPVIIQPTSEEKAILQAIKLGLNNANAMLGTIMDHSSPIIRAMVYSLGGGEDLAQDIIQDTFAAFLDHIHAGTIRYESKISTFIYSIARNLTLSALRKNAHTLVGRLEEQDEEMLQDGVDDSRESAMIVEEKMLFTHELISKLGEESSCVKLLLARFQPNFNSNAELAVQFGYKDAGVVSAQVHNCKKHLAKVIATNPILLCRAMDLLDDVHELEPLVTKHASRLSEVFQFLQGRMRLEAVKDFQDEMNLDPSLSRLVLALRPRFSH
jgi:RNA polymerase sigma factor (sigma-70 family)